MARLLSLAVFTLLIVAASTFGASAERRVALVIGNSQYKNANLSLTNPKNDADDVAATLKALGFEVIQSTDARKGDIDGALARFARLANESDSALFYYAGHAMQHQGRNYLMPVDAELEDEFSLRFNMVSLEDVRAALDRASGVKIMILDACRNNPLSERLTRNMSGQTRSVSSTRGLARIDKTQGMVVAYATAAEDVAMDGATGRNSPFTRALLRRMQEPGREITKMFQLVANDVRSETQGRQVPELSISLADDYYLNQNDRAIWEKLRESNDIPSIREFVDRFPYSIHVWAAKKRLDDLERWARDRENQQRLQFEASQRRELEEKLKQQQALFEAERRKQEAEAQLREAAQQRAEAERQRIEREREAQRVEEAKRLEAIESEKKRIAKEQADRQAEQQRAEAARRTKDEADRREQAAQRQNENQSAAADAQRLRDEQRAKDAAETQRRMEVAAREAEEVRKRKEETERLAKLEAERVQAKREADEREAARKVAEEQRLKIERVCQRERAAYGMIEADLAKLQSFVTKTACDEVRVTANDRIAALNNMAQACKSEGDILALLKGIGADKREQLVQFEKQMTCERLRPTAVAILAKLDAAPPAGSPEAQDPRELIRNTQIALRHAGCFSGADNGEENAATRAAVKRFRARTDGDEANLSITPGLLNEIKMHGAGTCEPISCPAGKVLRGDSCVAEIHKRPPVARAEPREPRREQAPAPRISRPEPVPQQAAAKPAPRALGIGF